MADDGEEFLELCEKLAEKGSVEHQLFLGRHFFKLAKHAAEGALDEDDECEGEGDGDGDSAEECGDKAVKWLMDAAKNGSIEATELLRQSLDECIGLSSETETAVRNYFDLKSQHKHVKRKATRKLFHQVKLTPDKPTVTEDDVVEVIKASGSKLGGSEERMVKRLAKKISKEGVKTEDEFVNVVKKHMKTSSPLYVDTQQYEKTPLKDKVLKYPLKTAEVVGARVVEGAARNGTKWLRSFVPYRQIQMMIAFCIYSVITLDALLFAVPLVFFYGSFAVMAITSLQILHGKQKIKDLTNWAKILHRLEPDVDATAEERKKTTKLITPFLWTYFASFIVALTSFSFADSAYIICSECMVISLFMAFGISMMNLDWNVWSSNFLIFASLLLSFVISLPHIFSNFPHIPVIYNIVAVFTKPLFTFSLIPGFSLNVSIPAAAYLVIPFIFLQMARQKAGRGLHMVLIPHLITVSWWHMAVMFFCSAPWLGLLRATVGYAMAILLFPITSLLVVGTLGVLVVKLFTWATLVKLLTTAALVVLPILFTMWYKSDKRLQNLPKKYKAALLTVIGVAAFVSSLSVLREETVLDRSTMRLSWKSYSSFCGTKARQRANSAQLQIRCPHLEGTLVKWRGTVSDVKISSVENVVLNVLDVLPSVMAEQLKCVYGEPFKPCTNRTRNHKYFQKAKKRLDEDDDLDDLDDAEDDSDDDDVTSNTLNTTETPNDEFCRFVDFYSSKCHVNQFNYYRFSISVNVGDSDQKFELQAGHHFKELCLALRPGSRLKFIGRLHSGLGTSSPTIRVYQMRCMNCLKNVSQPHRGSRRVYVKDPQVSLVKRCIESFGFVFNFFVSPLVTFETGTKI